MLITREYAPRLGLDLRGGTTVTLTARQSAGDAVTRESMETARTIISQRVDGLGVGESNVAIQGERQIEVSVPNVAGDELVRLVGRTAQLAFRNVYVAQMIQPPVTEPDPSASPNPSASPEPTAAPASASAPASAEPSAAASSAQRRVAPQLPTAPPTPRPTEPSGETKTLDELLAWQPSEQDYNEFVSFNCGDEFPDVADQPLITCDETGTEKYLLGPVLIKGDAVTNATAGVPQGQLRWQVALTFNGQGASDFHKVTQYLVTQQEPMNRFAIALDGLVVSAPVVEVVISGGEASISGTGINEKTAHELANVLRYGSLPLSFDVSSVDTVSATLGGEQLRAGLIAGAIGIALVVGYSFLYYRALGILVVASLAAAAALTWVVLSLLGTSVGFALNLPGVAGAVIGIGVTADSFIVYFERIRDEIRDGNSLTRSIESGWRKARGTIVIADSVQLLSALVLFFLAIGAVKGFAFTLLVTTIIDIYVVFFLTKPLLSILGRTKFFGEGHPASGLSPEHLGVPRSTLLGRRPRPSTVGSEA